jgi:hypothetical protein
MLSKYCQANKGRVCYGYSVRPNQGHMIKHVIDNFTRLTILRDVKKFTQRAILKTRIRQTRRQRRGSGTIFENGKTNKTNIDYKVIQNGRIIKQQ